MAKAEGILRLLLVDDSLTDADVITNVLRGAGPAVRAARHDTLAEIEQALNKQQWDLILCRDTLTTAPPQDLLNLIQRMGRDIPCIVLVFEPDNIKNFYSIGAQDVIAFNDSNRLQFAVERELQNLFMRRLYRRNKNALRESEKHAQLLLESSRDAVAYMHDGMHVYVNSAYLTLFGYEEAEDVDGLPMLDMVVVDDQTKFKAICRQFSEQTDIKPQTIAVQCLRADGSEFKTNIEFSHAQIEGEQCVQVIMREKSTGILAAEGQTAALRDHDFLTDLYSRARFMEELDQATQRASEGKSVSELLYIEIEKFQAIREQVGLGSSDMVLKGVAELLLAELAEGEVLARYSDQVFTVIIPTGDDKHVDERAEAYRKTVDDYTSQAGGKMIDLQCSIGISRITERFSSAQVALDHADSAYVQAQRAGGNRVTRYQPAKSEQGTTDEQDSAWQDRLQEALKTNSLGLTYQPIVSLHGEEQELYEVLLRMKDTDGTFINAHKFIKHLEHSDLMKDIDEWAITHALKSLTEHRLQHPKTRFFIKLSKQTLGRDEFIDWVCALLNSHNLDGSALVFEISETAALDNLDHAKRIISKLKNIGCEFGLEHFGSGLDFSHSLSELDVDYLKINGAFVQNMAKDTENQAAVKVIIDMTKEAGKHSIAEFVSDANSLALLWRLGVDYAQGYYIHEPSEELDYDFDDE